MSEERRIVTVLFAVNVAARLQQAADPWQVLVSERASHAAGHFGFGPELAVEAKGNATPITAREVSATGWYRSSCPSDRHWWDAAPPTSSCI